MEKEEKMGPIVESWPERPEQYPPDLSPDWLAAPVPYEPNEWNPDEVDDFHSPATITLGELIRYGVVVWGEPDTMWDYYDEKQYWRVCEKIEHHYWSRDIGFNNPGEFKRQFVRHMNEIMPKWKLAYKQLDAGVDLMRVGDSYGKSRDVDSDFPATQLNADQSDYASDASDHEYENVTDGDWLSRVKALGEYNDIDLEIVNSCEMLFSCLLTVNMNGGMGL